MTDENQDLRCPMCKGEKRFARHDHHDWMQDCPMCKGSGGRPTARIGVASSDLVVLIGQWEAEANMLRDGTHQKRQGLPRRQVLQEECAYRSCIADLKRLIQHNGPS